MENTVINFLKNNGFERNETNNYIKDQWNVTDEGGYYAIANGLGDTIYSNDLNIYWLIGVLTYYGIIDKDYKI